MFVSKRDSLSCKLSIEDIKIKQVQQINNLVSVEADVNGDREIQSCIGIAKYASHGHALSVLSWLSWHHTFVPVVTFLAVSL